MNSHELEWRLLYSMVVAGKSAEFATKALQRFLSPLAFSSPFQNIRYHAMHDTLDYRLRHARTGNYGKLARGFEAVAKAGFDLSTCTAEQLEAIHGIGPKTSRFFILWTRPDARHAALDTHVLKWLRYLGHDAPKSTPSGQKYAVLEKVMLDEADRRGITARALDALIWDYCSGAEYRAGEWPAGLKEIPPRT